MSERMLGVEQVTQTLAEWLLACIAEDEAAAQAASPSPWQYPGIDSVAGGTLYDATRRIVDVVYEQPGDHDGSIVRHLLSDEADANGQHIARHDPAHVLAVCEAHRRIVALHAPDDEGFHICHDSLADDSDCGELRALAAIYADRDGFREEWR